MFIIFDCKTTSKTNTHDYFKNLHINWEGNIGTSTCFHSVFKVERQQKCKQRQNIQLPADYRLRNY